MDAGPHSSRLARDDAPRLSSATAVAAGQPSTGTDTLLPMAWLGRLIAGNLWLLVPLVFIALAVLGWGKLEQPFGRDQLIHHWVALRLLDGASLYRDVWEVKPPALYLLHALAIRFIDATPRGIHLVELAWQLLFAVVLMAALRRYYRQRWLAILAPLVCLAPYYAYVRPYAQTQAEILVCLPLFVAAWAALAAAAATGHRRFLAAWISGIAAGVVTAFKHVLAPLPLAFLLTALVFAQGKRSAPARPTSAATAAALAIPFAGGLLLVWAPLFLWVDATGGGSAFLWTLFVWPLELLATADPAPLARLGESMAVFVAMMAPYLALVLIAAPAAFQREEPPWTAMLWVWLAVGLAVIVGQRVGWLTYHFLLLFPPVGLLALRVIDRFAEDLARRARLTMAEQRGLAAAAVVLALAALAYPVGETARTLYKAFAVDRLSSDDYRRAAFPDYAAPAAVADYLRRYGQPGTVYAVESLAVPVLAGRDIGQPVPGQWLALLPLAGRWQQLPDELRRCPPAYFLVETAMAPLLAQRYPALAETLAADYRPVFASDYGRLYEHRPSAPAAGQCQAVDKPAGSVN